VISVFLVLVFIGCSWLQRPLSDADTMQCAKGAQVDSPGHRPGKVTQTRQGQRPARARPGRSRAFSPVPLQSKTQAVGLGYQLGRLWRAEAPLVLVSCGAHLLARGRGRGWPPLTILLQPDR
jgi:hypothetical protein